MFSAERSLGRIRRLMRDDGGHVGCLITSDVNELVGAVHLWNPPPPSCQKLYSLQTSDNNQSRIIKNQTLRNQTRTEKRLLSYLHLFFL